MKNSIRAQFFIILGLILSPQTVLADPLPAGAPQTPERQFTVIGDALGVIAPDTVEIRAVLETTGPNAAASIAAADKRESALGDALKKLNVTDLTVTNEGSRILGNGNTLMIASGSPVTIKRFLMIRSGALDRAGLLVDEILKAGASSVSEARYTVRDGSKVQAQILAQALTRAKEKAEKSSAALGIRIVRVANIVVNEEPTQKLIRVRERQGEGEELPGASDYQVSAVVTFDIEPTTVQ